MPVEQEWCVPVAYLKAELWHPEHPFFLQLLGKGTDSWQRIHTVKRCRLEGGQVPSPSGKVGTSPIPFPKMPLNVSKIQQAKHFGKITSLIIPTHYETNNILLLIDKELSAASDQGSSTVSPAYILSIIFLCPPTCTPAVGYMLHTFLNTVHAFFISSIVIPLFAPRNLVPVLCFLTSYSLSSSFSNATFFIEHFWSIHHLIKL